MKQGQPELFEREEVDWFFYAGVKNRSQLGLVFFIPNKNHKQSETENCEFYLAKELTKSLSELQ